MVVAEISITPVVGDEMRPYIDAAVEEIKKSGLKYEVEAMGTTVEGEMDEVFMVIKKAHDAVKQKGANRILTEIRIDDKASGVTIQDEVAGYRASV